MKCIAISFKTLSVFVFFLFLVGRMSAQITSIPDSQFELALVDLGYDSDGVINGEVLTADISSRTELTINGYNIANFQGLQDFTALQNFSMFNNLNGTNLQIDFSGNLNLLEIYINNAPFLNQINVSQNTLLKIIDVSTNGNLLTSIDTSANLELTDLIFVYESGIESLDLFYNTKITNLHVANNPIEVLDVSRLRLLESLVLVATGIENLNLYYNDKLKTVNAYNGVLKTVNLYNANNTNITYFDVTNNPDLNYILVDDITFAQSATNWFKDGTAAYIEDTISIDSEAENKTVQADGSGNISDLNTWINVHGFATASTSCGLINWTYTYYHDQVGIDLIYTFDFFATDDCESFVVTSAEFKIQNAYVFFEEEFYGSGDTICEESFDLNSVIIGIEPAASLTSSKVTGFYFNNVAGQESASFSYTDVDFPDTGAGSYTYQFEVEADIELSVYEPKDGTMSRSAFTEEAFITISDKTVPYTVELLPENLSVCTSEINSIQDLSDLLIVSPDDQEFPPQNGAINRNDYWTPSVYNGLGTYVFDASSAVQGCPSNAVSITVMDLNPFVLVENAQDLTVMYNPNGNDTEVNNWIANNGGSIATSCETITWEWKIVEFQLNTDVNPDDTYLACNIEFKAFDVNENEIGSSTAQLKYETFPSAGLSLGFGENLCGNESYDLNQISSIDSSSPYFAASVITIVQLSGPGQANTDDEDIDFPDTGAGNFAYEFDYQVSTTLDIAGKSLIVEDSSELTVLDLTIPFNPGAPKTLTVCKEQVVTLADLYSKLEIVDGTEDLNFNPDNYWTPSTYQGPGEYVFNAEAFLPQCGGIPTTVTVTEETPLLAGTNGTLEIESGETLTEQLLYNALQGNKDIGGTWSPALAGAGIYTYTHLATEVCAETSTTVTVSNATLSILEKELSQLIVYPNPTKDVVFIKGNTQIIKQIKLFNIKGQLLIFNKTNRNTIDMQFLEPGVYFLNLMTENATKTVKIIKN